MYIWYVKVYYVEQYQVWKGTEIRSQLKTGDVRQPRIQAMIRSQNGHELMCPTQFNKYVLIASDVLSTVLGAGER